MKVEEKMGLWMENGAELAWLIDPIEGSVTIHAAGAAPRVLQQPTVVAGEGPVVGFTLRATRLWAGHS